MSDPFGIDPEDEQRWAEEWAAADQHAARVLLDAWPAVVADDAPPAGVDDSAAWLRAVAETISPTDEPDWSVEDQASVYSLEHADWLAVVVGLVRRGVGAELTAEDVVTDLEAMDEIDGAGAEDDEYVVPVEVLAPLWQELGVLDADRRLTAAGAWGLPRALYGVWSSSSA